MVGGVTSAGSERLLQVAGVELVEDLKLGNRSGGLGRAAAVVVELIAAGGAMVSSAARISSSDHPFAVRRRLDEAGAADRTANGACHRAALVSEPGVHRNRSRGVRFRGRPRANLATDTCRRRRGGGRSKSARFKTTHSVRGWPRVLEGAVCVGLAAFVAAIP
jgi:hypothetical protein